MTRRSKREIERAVDDLANGDRSIASLEEVLAAERLEAVSSTQADGQAMIYRIDGVEKTVTQKVLGDMMRVFLGGEPRHHDPPDDLVNQYP